MGSARIESRLYGHSGPDCLEKLISEGRRLGFILRHLPASHGFANPGIVGSDLRDLGIANEIRTGIADVADMVLAVPGQAQGESRRRTCRSARLTALRVDKVVHLPDRTDDALANIGGCDVIRHPAISLAQHENLLDRLSRHLAGNFSGLMPAKTISHHQN